MALYARSELQELVDSPNETLSVEYKGWLDLADSNEVRADLARHIAALSNHGGGTIVLGMTDTMKFAGPNPFPKVVYDRDLISGIVKKYLEPTFQCDVLNIKSATGNDHPVIVVPPHGAAPICAKASGPSVDGKSKGITQGVHYIRKPGPESAAIVTAAEWAPLIRRCAMHERGAILGALDAAMRGSSSLPSAPMDALKVWHEAAHAVFLKDIIEQKAPSELTKWHCQFSYAIERDNGQQLDPKQLLEILRQVNGEVNEFVRTGWSMFHVFSRAERAPFFNTDPASGQGEQDFLECALLRDSKPFLHGADTWRVSPDGKVTLIREYWEDVHYADERQGLVPGTLFSPNLMVRSLAEFVFHARGLSARFDSPTTVSFRCEWHGLAGRRIFDPAAIWMDHPVARSDHRVVSGSWPVSTLSNNWAEVVANLSAPVARLFTVEHVLTPDWIRGQAPRWQR